LVRRHTFNVAVITSVRAAPCCSSVRRLPASLSSACDVIGSLCVLQFLIHSTFVLVYFITKHCILYNRPTYHNIMQIWPPSQGRKIGENETFLSPVSFPHRSLPFPVVSSLTPTRPKTIRSLPFPFSSYPFLPSIPPQSPSIETAGFGRSTYANASMHSVKIFTCPIRHIFCKLSLHNFLKKNFTSHF